jgi:hypothetical protein
MNGLIIHHWDTDGICSAALFLKKFGDFDLKIPHIGNYFLKKEEIEDISAKGYDWIIILDMAIEKKSILDLANISKVSIFDHHLQEEIREAEHHNPIINGRNPERYPSTSWIINEYFGNSVNLFSLLGIVGDHEERIKKNEFIYAFIKKFCIENGLEFKDLLQMVHLLDSNYKLCKKEGVEKAPYILLKYTDPRDILNNEQWNENLEILNKEIDDQLQTAEKEINNTIFKEINTPYNIISTVTRKLAWDSGKNVIVVNTGFFHDQDQVYVRSNNNLKKMIERAKAMGFNAGGKNEVLGAIVPKKKRQPFVKEIIDFLEGK